MSVIGSLGAAAWISSSRFSRFCTLGALGSLMVRPSMPYHASVYANCAMLLEGARVRARSANRRRAEYRAAGAPDHFVVPLLLPLPLHVTPQHLGVIILFHRPRKEVLGKGEHLGLVQHRCEAYHRLAVGRIQHCRGLKRFAVI